jgi:selenocysteine-specific elongation factor
LLGITSGLIVLSKVDTVDDAGWLALVEDEIRTASESTSLADAPIVRVSAFTGAGIPQLVEDLSQLLSNLPPHVDRQQPRLPIDRVFTLSGFGTVVTGTLIGGSLRVGDDIEIHPIGTPARIRGLQSYKTPVETAQPGSRVAVNLTGIEKGLISRGHVLTHPNFWEPTSLADVHYRHLPSINHALKHNTEVKVFVGSAEVTARVRLLSHDMLLPGEDGWLQLQFAAPLLLAQGDRFILRIPSPGQTIGGGVVADPHPTRKWKRRQENVLRQLATRMNGTPEEQLAQAAMEPIKQTALQRQVGLDDGEFEQALAEAIQKGVLIELGDRSLLSVQSARHMLHRMEQELRSFHETQPLRLGMPREELRSRSRIQNVIMNALIELQKQIVVTGNQVHLANHQVRFTEAQQGQVDALMDAMNAAPYAPPSLAEAAQMVSEDVLYAMIEMGQLIQVQADVIFTRALYNELVSTVLQMIDQHGSITVAMLRDRFGTSRKYAIGLLEYLDAEAITKRDGDVRVRGSRAAQLR